LQFRDISGKENFWGHFDPECAFPGLILYLFINIQVKINSLQLLDPNFMRYYKDTVNIMLKYRLSVSV